MRPLLLLPLILGPLQEGSDEPPQRSGPGPGEGRTEREEAQRGDKQADPGAIPLEELTGAEREEALALMHLRLEEEYFLACDGNGNGWLSFREIRDRLRSDRDEFFQFDADRDGRVDRTEFGNRYRFTVDAVGSFRPPDVPQSLFPTAEGSPLEFDFNGSGALDEGELRAFLKERSIEVPASVLFEHLDTDASGALEVEEFAEVVATLSTLMPDLVLPTVAPDSGDAEPAPTTVEELFGEREEPDERFGTAPGPARIRGPVPHFYRLDHDGDGYLDAEDFAALLRPARLDVRASAVIAALDRDLDGRLSPEEFHSSLEP